MTEKGIVSVSDLKTNSVMAPQRILEVQEGDFLDVSPAESKRVLRKIDFWSVQMKTKPPRHLMERVADNTVVSA
jgi:hypothetical protein